ncbi:MAG: sensor histidine kinase [Candidatus Dormibacteria bacterium]
MSGAGSPGGPEAPPTEVLTTMARLGTDAGLLLDSGRLLLWSSPNAQGLLASSDPTGALIPPPLTAGTPLALILDDPRAGDLAGAAQERGEVQRSEISQDGWRRVLRAVAAPISGPRPAVLLILSDITHERRLSRAHQELLANLSHDLRTPLASLTLLAETLNGEARGDPVATKEFASRIAKEAAHLHELVSGILDLARLEAGAERANLEVVDLLEVVRQVCAGLAPQAHERRQTLRCSGQPTVARADPARLQRALSNILDNAIKFTGEGGVISVAAEEVGGCPTISVKDTGSGIAASALPRIFDRFYTGDRSRSGSGSGLGLAIARQAVELQGGRIEVSSRPGSGTEVRIQLCPHDPDP